MRVAAISDIHGNLPALEAVLADIERETVDAIVVVGDTLSAGHGRPRSSIFSRTWVRSPCTETPIDSM